MDKQKKKIIAREGLVIIAIIVGGYLLTFLGDGLNEVYHVTSGQSEVGEISLLTPYHFWNRTNIPDFFSSDPNPIKLPYSAYIGIGGVRLFRFMEMMGLIIAVFGYPFYLFIRFIIWAVRTLKEKS